MARNVIFGARLSVIQDRADEGIAYLQPDGWAVDDTKGEALRMTVLPLFQAEHGQDWDIVVSDAHPGVITLYFTGDGVVNKRTRKKQTLEAAEAFIACYRKHKGKARTHLDEAERELTRRRQSLDDLTVENHRFAVATAREVVG